MLSYLKKKKKRPEFGLFTFKNNNCISIAFVQGTTKKQKPNCKISIIGCKILTTVHMLQPLYRVVVDRSRTSASKGHPLQRVFKRRCVQLCYHCSRTGDPKSAIQWMSLRSTGYVNTVIINTHEHSGHWSEFYDSSRVWINIKRRDLFGTGRKQ